MAANMMFVGGLILMTSSDHMFWKDIVGIAFVVFGLDRIIASHNERIS